MHNEEIASLGCWMFNLIDSGAAGADFIHLRSLLDAIFLTQTPPITEMQDINFWLWNVMVDIISLMFKRGKKTPRKYKKQLAWLRHLTSDWEGSAMNRYHAKGDPFLSSRQLARPKSDVVSSEQKKGLRVSLQLPQSSHRNSSLLQALRPWAVTATSSSSTMCFFPSGS